MTTDADCIQAPRDAATRLGGSPSKAQYEALGLTPSSATIIRVLGGWNRAKELAELETNPSRGSRTEAKPDDVDLPASVEWGDMTVDRRWHYRNVAWNTERTRRRRAELRAWVNGFEDRTWVCSVCGGRRRLSRLPSPGPCGERHGSREADHEWLRQRSVTGRNREVHRALCELPPKRALHTTRCRSGRPVRYNPDRMKGPGSVR